MIIYAKSSPLHRCFSRRRRRRKGTDFKAPTLMFLVARRSVGGRTDERGRGGEREGEGHSSLPPSVPPYSTRQIIICAAAERSQKDRRAALPFDAASPQQLPLPAAASPPMMLRAEKTDEHKLPHFIDNQPRSTAARTREREEGRGHGSSAAGKAWK